MKLIGALPCVLCLSLLPSVASAQIVSSSTNNWTPIKYGGNGVLDPSQDQQTGQRESDLVGSVIAPSAYTLFDPGVLSNHTDGTLFFRVRVAEDSQSAGYSGYLWVGIDANSDGAVDIFAGVDRQGSSAQNVLRNPGTGLNSSPNTTSIDSANLAPSPYLHTTSNYNWAPVSAANYTGTNFDVDAGGNTDYFMSFSLSFQDLVNAVATTGSGRPVGLSITDATAFGFVVATSQQGNSINQDYNGGNVPVNSATTFVSLGAISDGTPAISAAIPEPGSLALAALGMAGLLLAQKRRPKSTLNVRAR
jgi:PEP-CTERM motif